MPILNLEQVLHEWIGRKTINEVLLGLLKAIPKYLIIDRPQFHAPHLLLEGVERYGLSAELQDPRTLRRHYDVVRLHEETRPILLECPLTDPEHLHDH